MMYLTFRCFLIGGSSEVVTGADLQRRSTVAPGRDSGPASAHQRQCPASPGGERTINGTAQQRGRSDLKTGTSAQTTR